MKIPCGLNRNRLNRRCRLSLQNLLTTCRSDSLIEYQTKGKVFT
jgi:hypothetical protein